MTPDGDGSGDDLDGEGAGPQPGGEAPGVPSRMTEATPRQAIVAVAVLCGLCLVIGIVLGRTL